MSINSDYTSRKVFLSKPVFDITPFTALDYPQKTACIIWFAGCNLRCPYCYNPEIVFGKGRLSLSESLAFIKTRQDFLDGVVLSGGECTLHQNIAWFVREIKNMGMLVKIDTNGSSPCIIKQLIQDHLIDYVALDFKALEEKWPLITRRKFSPYFEETYEILSSADLPFEIRTTVHSALFTPSDIDKMISFLEKKEYRGVYYIQNFINNTPTISNMPGSAPLELDRVLASRTIKIEVRNQS